MIRNIRSPLIHLSNLTGRFSAGNLTVRSRLNSYNEFGELSVAFNNLADSIQKELILKTKSSQLAEIMLKEDDSHSFCHKLLTNLLEETGAQMGVVFLLNEKKTNFEHFESIGLNPAVKKSFSATDFEGEFGLALSTKKIQHTAIDLEHNRFSYKTVMGDLTPIETITIPLISSKETIAIISLANINHFSKSSVDLLENILSILSARMDGILSNRKIIDFSHHLEAQNAELEAQKNELVSQSTELIEQNVELEMQKKQLDQANKMKTIFLSNMSHELRTPLNSVIALAGVLNRRLVNKVEKEEYSYIDVIERNGKQLLTLINDILDLSRIESGREEITFNIFNPNDLINEILDLINPQAVQKNIELSYISNKSLPNMGSDYEKCRHILQNIIANAVKFTETGSVKVNAYADTQFIYFTVTDTGIGIAEEDLKNIFDEFKQVDGSNSRKFGGTGLGLAIAKKYTELLSGNISVISEPNKGSEFTLRVPIFIGKNGTENEKPTDFTEILTKKTSSNSIIDKTKKTILLVEDSKPVIIQMKDILTSEGYRILVAQNGKEALEILENDIPDGIILDLMMPEIDGFEVLKQVREQEQTEQVPVIILTAKYVNKDELAFLKHNHIHQLIRKGDINRNHLLEAVESMIAPNNIRVIEAAPIKPIIPEIKQPNIKSGRKKGAEKTSILIVEDNADNMLTLKAMLGNRFTIIEAINGRMGIEMTHLHRPNLILMDYELPEMNGTEALKEIKKVNSLKEIPIIAITANAMKGDRENFIADGFSDYMAKPIDYAQLMKMLNQWTGLENESI